VNEHEWLACSDSQELLRFLHESLIKPERKLRRLALACCARIWHLLPEEGRRLARAVEDYADGLATRHERDAAVAAFRKLHGRFGSTAPTLRAVYNTKAVSFDPWTAASVAVNAAIARRGLPPPLHDGLPPPVLDFALGELRRCPAFVEECAAQAVLLRDIFGPLPFRPLPLLALHVLTWNDGCVVNLARVIDDDRPLPGGSLDNTRLAVLADAMEEAGCDNEEVLAHLRQPGQVHVRGCWVVDLLLNKQ
jgi:hypothetical protein